MYPERLRSDMAKFLKIAKLKVQIPRKFKCMHIPTCLNLGFMEIFKVTVQKHRTELYNQDFSNCTPVPIRNDSDHNVLTTS